MNTQPWYIRLFNTLKSLWDNFWARNWFIKILILIGGGIIVWIGWHVLKALWSWILYPYIIHPLGQAIGWIQ